MYNPLYLNDVIKSNEMKIISEYWKPSFMWASQQASQPTPTQSFHLR